MLAALDATKEAEIGSRFNVKGYPTVKYFVNGEFKFDVSVRDADKIVEFMKVWIFVTKYFILLNVNFSFYRTHQNHLLHHHLKNHGKRSRLR